MSKQDRQGVRTINDLERKYYFDRAFAEVMGVANDAQKAADNARDAANKYANDIKGELKLVVKKDENEQIVSMLNASANVIKLKGNRVSIESDNFTLTEDGKITAKKGTFDNCEIKETCTIMGTLRGSTLARNSSTLADGEIVYSEYSPDASLTEAYYQMRIINKVDTTKKALLYLNTDSLGELHAELMIYKDGTASGGIAIADTYTRVFSSVSTTLGSTGTTNFFNGTWKYNNSEIANKDDISALNERLKALEGA